MLSTDSGVGVAPMRADIHAASEHLDGMPASRLSSPNTSSGCGVEERLTKLASLPEERKGLYLTFTGLNLAEAEDLCDWLENRGYRYAEISIFDGSRFEVRVSAEPNILKVFAGFPQAQGISPADLILDRHKQTAQLPMTANMSDSPHTWESQVLLKKALGYLKDFCQSRPDQAKPLQSLRRLFALFGIIATRQKDHRMAAEAADGLADSDPQDGSSLFDSACSLARCARMVQGDPELTNGQKLVLIEQYHDRAMRCLDLAIRKGFRDSRLIHNDIDLQDLRSRPDFNHLLSCLPPVNEKIMSGS